MADPKTEKAPKKGAKTETAVAVVQPNAGAIVIPNYGDDIAGAGWDNTNKDDFQIPFLNQLQALSPQCEEGGERQVEGAKPGMFFNSVSEKLYTGDLYLLIALTKHCFVEWRPQDSGGGFVAEHDVISEVVAKAKEVAAKTDNARDLKTPAGNDLVETYHVYALLLESPDATEFIDQVVISFTKTKIKRYKQIMTRLRTFKNSQRIPLFAHRLLMSVTNEQNAAKKSYKNVQLVPAIGGDVGQSLLAADSPLLELANSLREGIVGGAVKVNFDSAAAPASGGGGDDTEADAVFGESPKGQKG